MNDHQPDEIAKFLHQNIPSADIPLIRSFLEKQVLMNDERYCNGSMETAAAVAIKSNRFDVYELLLSFGICLGQHENIQELLVNQPITERRKILSIHKKYFKDANIKHLMILNSKSSLSHEASAIDRPIYLEHITKAFEELNSLDLIEPILKVVSTSEKLKIVFDFNRDSVENLDPTKNAGVLGTTYFNDHHIYVGSKGLLDEDEGRCQALGVLIHEMCHYAMNVLYYNKCKPYHIKDQEKFDEFDAIVEATATKKDGEDFIAAVYNCHPNVHHAELIVRVPHLTALYKDDDDKLKEASEQYFELFQFFKTNILLDLQRNYPLIEAKQVLIGLFKTLEKVKNSEIELSTEGLNIDLSENGKIIFISSNCPKITMAAIYHKYRADIDNESMIIGDLKSLQNDQTFEIAIKAISLCRQPELIIDCGGLKVDEVKKIIQKLSQKQIDKRIVFVVDQSSGLFSDSCLEVKHSWSHFSIDFQRKLLQKNVNFHGRDIQLGDLMKDLSLMESIPFDDLLTERIILIEKVEVDENNGTLIERMFLPPVAEKLESSEVYNIEYDFERISGFAETNQIILLADQPGMGKSTTFKMLLSKLRVKYLSRWIVLMDLNHYFKVFQVDNKITIKFKDCDEIIDFFCAKILKIKGFDAEIFKQLFKNERVILLMDGLDEVCPSYKKFIFDLMLAIKNFSRNQIWISTRTHLMNELDNDLHPALFRLKPFTKENRRQYFMNFFILNGKDERYVEEKLKEIDQWDKRFGFNPLLLKMVAECIDEFMFSSDSAFLLYDQCVNKMIERCFEKGPEAKKSIVKTVGKSNINKFYQKSALKICFEGEESASKMINLCFTNVSKPTIDDLSRVGLMFSEDSENFQFIHRTFAEFQVAKFFQEKIFLDKYLPGIELQSIVESLMEVLKYEKSHVIASFLDEALSTFEIGENWQRTKEIFTRFSTEQYVKVLMQLIKNGCFNIIQNLLLHFCSKPCELIFARNSGGANILMQAASTQSINFNRRLFSLFEKILDSDQLKVMLHERDGEDQDVLHFAIKNRLKEVINFFIREILSVTDKASLAHLLMQSNKAGEIILLRALNTHSYNYIRDFFENLVEIVDPDQLEEMFVLRNREDENIFHCAVKNKDVRVFIFLIRKVEEMNDRAFLTTLLKQKDKSGQISLLQVLSICFEIIDEVLASFEANINSDVGHGLLFGTDQFYQNMFYAISELSDLEISKFLFDAFSPFLTSNQFISYMFQHIYNLSLEFFEEEAKKGAEKKMNDPLEVVSEKVEIFSKKIIERMLENPQDQKVFHFALKDRVHPEVIRFITRVMKLFPEKEFFKNFLIITNPTGENLIMRAARSNSVAANELLFAALEAFFDANELEKIVLHRDFEDENILYYAIKNPYLELFSVLVEIVKALPIHIDTLKNLFAQNNKRGENLILRSIHWQTIEFNECFFFLLEDFLDTNQLKAMLMNRNVENENLFHYAVKNGIPDIFSFYIKKVESLSDKNFLCNILLQKNKRGENFIMLATVSQSFAFNENLMGILKETFIDDFLKTLFLQNNDENENVFHYAAVCGIPEIFNFYAKQVESITDRKFLNNLLMQRNGRGENVVFRAVHSQSIEFNENVYGILEKTFDLDQLETLLLERNRKDENIFHYAALNGQPEIFSFYTAIVFSITDHSFLVDLLMQSNNIGENVLMCVVSSQSIAFTQFFFDSIEENLDSDQFKKMLLKHNQKNKSLIDLAAYNQDPDVLSFVTKKVESVTGQGDLINLLMCRATTSSDK